MYFDSYITNGTWKVFLCTTFVWRQENEILRSCIITNNVSKLSDFYKSIFNTLPEGNENHVAFDNMNLAIWNPGNAEISKVKNMSLMYFVDDAKYEYERLLNINGIEMVSEPEMQPWGVIAFIFKDPDGNEISFIQQLNKVER